MFPRFTQVALATGLALALAACSASGDLSDEGTGVTVVASDSVDLSYVTDTATIDEAQFADLDLEEADAPSTDGAITVTLADGASSASSSAVEIAGDTITITAAGTYVISGTLSSGQVVVNADDADVNLILDGVHVTSATTAALWVQQADGVVVWLADGSTNSLADGTTAPAESTDEDIDTPNAALYSADDLWIGGAGTLTVDGSLNDGITSKDSLVVQGGTVSVTAADDGIRGKDHLLITAGAVTVTASGDGLKSDEEDLVNDDGEPVGVIWVADGTVSITAGSDGADAARQITIAGGSVEIAADDDGLHSDAVLRISGGDLTIEKSYEGIEGAVIGISGGVTSIVSSDDGVNVSDGSGSGGEPGGFGGGDGAPPGDGTRPDGEMPSGDRPARPGDDTGTTDGSVLNIQPASTTTAATATTAVSDVAQVAQAGPMDAANSSLYLQITGGTLVVDADGDGLDSNGSITMSGGLVVVYGPTANNNGALDSNGGIEVTGGTLLAVGSAGMAESPDSGGQAVLELRLDATVAAGTVVSIEAADGTPIAAFETTKDISSVVFTSPDLEAGATYTILTGGPLPSGDTAGLVLGSVAQDATELGQATAR